MKKEFYTGQPLIIKNTGEKVTFLYDDGDRETPCYALKEKRGKQFYHDYYDYHELYPSTEFKFSEIIAGLEQSYFEEGMKFRRLRTDSVLTVAKGYEGLYLQGERELPSLTSKYINSTWNLVGSHKEMTLEEIEDELGYKIKLIE